MHYFFLKQIFFNKPSMPFQSSFFKIKNPHIVLKFKDYLNYLLNQFNYLFQNYSYSKI